MWISLEMPIPAEGFKISRLSTVFRNHIPSKRMKFDMGRLRELEERASRDLPDPAKNWTDDYLAGICDQQLHSYLSYIALKEGFLTEDDSIFTPVFMWLVGGRIIPSNPDQLKPFNTPYSRLSYGESTLHGEPVASFC
ncbi:hypothetical protein FOZ62_013146 [Perkinsus olseni]|uniref:Uncharacterized protein n=2 Tax=Perkinsus olseni TaxID=32597 RepID=A0A7J6QHY7_PEROL|nr:hypothetical protein FOZ62_013146 [Perkinsus olseni]